jgi:uncharacterized peroxidase-related enzyme
MPRIHPLASGQGDANTQATLASVKAKIGMVPNLFATFAVAPAALQAYLGFSEALSHGRLSAAQREIIALAVAQTNSCQYCLSAHVMIGKGSGLSPQNIADARTGQADQPLDQALLTLAIQVVRRQGQLADEDLAAARAAGLDDGLVVEVIANVALNLLTNYTNHAAQTVVDFPVVKL